MNESDERRSGNERRSNWRDSIEKLNLLRSDMRELRDQLNETLSVLPDSELWNRAMTNLDKLIERESKIEVK